MPHDDLGSGEGYDTVIPEQDLDETHKIGKF